ncbi:MFS transporter [Paenibacillus hamazuiensis]|uniref:MFS transporter n=1 Tax=Paenibacillus hamazuiensis TaxID=2936508 RepID=UPI00200E8371|nr:MFS transporter [Paenibacillus hamazuiensis]
MHSDSSKQLFSPGWGRWKKGGYFRGSDWERGRSGGKKREQTAALTGQSRLLLTVNGLFAVGNALSGTFVNVYLWKARQDFALLGWFTLIHHLTMAFTFWLAGKWVKEHNKMNCLRAGVAVSALFYLVVLWLGAAAVDYFPLLGIIQGMSSGFFWIAFNVVYFEVTSPANRDKFNGWAGLLGSLAGMIAPWVSGFLIVRMEAASGYRLIFTMSLVIFLIGVVCSFFLKKRKSVGRYEWFLTLRCLKRAETPWRTVGLALVAQGMREGVFGFMIALMVYIATGTEMKIGNFSLITSAVALFSFMIVGRLLKPSHRKWAMFAGAFVMVAVIVPFFWRVNYATLLVFGVGVALFTPLYTIPMTSSVFDLIGQFEESVKKREEYIVMRELGLNAGRMLGTLIFTFVVMRTTSPTAINWLLLGIGSSPLLAWFFMRRQLGQLSLSEKAAAAAKKAAR